MALISGITYETADAVPPGQAVEIVSKVLSMVLGVKGSHHTAKWQHQTTDKLNLIIAQNDDIIARLKDLKLFIPEALAKNASDELIHRVTAYVDQVDDAMRAPKVNRNKFQTLSPQIVTLAYDLRDRGPAIYQAEAVAASLALLTGQMAGDVSPEERNSFLRKIIASFEEWSSDDPGMFGRILKDHIASRDELQGKLAQVHRGDVVIGTIQSTHDVGPARLSGTRAQLPCTINIRAQIDIDESKASYTISNVRSDGCDGGATEGAKNNEVAAQKGMIDNIVGPLTKERQDVEELTHHIESLRKFVEMFKAELG